MTISYKLVRSGRRTLCMEIGRDGTVTVRAPYGMSDGEIERFVESHSAWVKKHTAMLEAGADREEEMLSREDELRARAESELPKKVAKYAALMKVKPVEIKITSAKKRFGSCNSRGGICFSWRLMYYPDEAIDYVVVHELAHLRHMNHGASFYALIEKYMPDYKERKKLLK